MHTDHKILHVSLYVCDFIQTLIKNCLKNVYWLSLDSWFLFSTLKWKWKSLTRVSLGPHGLYSPWNSPGHNTGGGSLSLLQWIFPIQESNQGLLHWRQILCHLNHKGNLHILPRRKRIISKASMSHINYCLYSKTKNISSSFSNCVY